MWITNIFSDVSSPDLLPVFPKFLRLAFDLLLGRTCDFEYPLGLIVAAVCFAFDFEVLNFDFEDPNFDVEGSNFDVEGSNIGFEYFNFDFVTELGNIGFAAT